MTVKELKERSGMSLKEFAEYFGIPYRTMQNWVAGYKPCADYIVRMLGSVSSNRVYQVWNFTKNDVSRIKTFIDVHGIGKYKEDNALTEFLQEFNYCRER